MFPEFRDPRNDPRKGRSYNQEFGRYMPRRVAGSAGPPQPTPQPTPFPWYQRIQQDTQRLVNPMLEKFKEFMQRPEWGFDEFNDGFLQKGDDVNPYKLDPAYGTPTPTPTGSSGKNQSPIKPPTPKPGSKLKSRYMGKTPRYSGRRSR